MLALNNPRSAATTSIIALTLTPDYILPNKGSWVSGRFRQFLKWFRDLGDTRLKHQGQPDRAAAKISHSSQIRLKNGILLTTVAGHSSKGNLGRIEPRGVHDDIHQLHSSQHPHTRIEPLKGNDLASVEGHYTETHHYRSACARTGLAASRWSSLVVQKIYRRGSGLAV